MDQYQQLWNQTKEKLQVIYDSDTFDETFTKITSVVKFSNGTIYVLCPNPLLKTKMNNVYYQRIQQTLQDLTEQNVRFKFVTADEVIETKPEIKEDKINKDNIFNARLNPNYTFSSFVVGESNKFAFRQAYAVSNPSQGVFVANPLYIFGGVGLGKTHLMQAIGNAILDNDINKRVLYIAATEFIDDYTKACVSQNFDSFQAKYDNLDAILVDDIQMLSNGKKSQQEFFKLFNKMHENKKLIVIAADKPADQLKDIMDRLTSRFNWGLAVDIKIPDLDHRVEILRKKLSDTSDKTISDDVLRYIANNFSNNIRELESTLNRVILLSIQYDCDIDIDFAKKAIEPLIQNRKNGGDQDAYEKVRSVVADFYNISVADLIGTKRNSNIIIPRHICMYILKVKYDLAYKKIGDLLGGKDHTTVIAAVTKITHEKENVESIRMALERIIAKIDN